MRRKWLKQVMCITTREGLRPPAEDPTEIQVACSALSNDFVVVALQGRGRLVAPPELRVRADDETPRARAPALHCKHPAARVHH